MSEETTSLRVEPSPKRVRAYLGGELVFDTLAAVLVWEIPNYPAYYIPRADVRADLIPSGRTEAVAHVGEAHFLDVATTSHNAAEGARELPALAALRDLVRFEWRALDNWFEEDEEVIVHPRSPYARIDILNSSRHVQIAVSGVGIADSRQPRLLFETGLLTRYYLPLVDVRMELLRPSSRSTSCPYKGHASYWSVDAGGELIEDVAWTYKTPLQESLKIAGLVAFFNERVDITVDGVLQGRPN